MLAHVPLKHIGCFFFFFFIEILGKFIHQISRSQSWVLHKYSALNDKTFIPEAGDLEVRLGPASDSRCDLG